MTVKAMRFFAILMVLGASVFSQTDRNFTEENPQETPIASTIHPDDGTTLASISSGEINIPENGTEFPETLVTTEENSTGEGNITQVPLSNDGTNITDNTRPCTDHICENGGTCVFMSHESDYKCLCPSNYIGNKCETLDNCTLDEDGILCKYGACVYGQNRKYRYCKCFLGHYWDILKAQCRPPKEPCFPNPCQSGGNCTAKSTGEYRCTCQKRFFGRNCEMEDTCSVSERGVECENGYCLLDTAKNSKLCKCNEGFYLDVSSMQCRKSSPPCEPNPCMNSGLCRAVSVDKYNCTCTGDYIGERCQILNRCKPDPSGEICKNGMCKQDGMHTKRCFCSKGYYFDENSAECKEVIAPCLPNPCANGGICNAISSSEFNCSCSEEFYGKVCTYINRCVSEGNEFCKDAECVMKDDNGGYICRCPQGEHFDYGSRKCKVTDVCPLFYVKENAACKNNTVTCFENFRENNDTGLCEPNFCETKGCPAEGMICEESAKDPENFKCSCKKGYSFDGNVCKAAFCTIPGLNSCEQICEEEDNSFTCKCDDLFTLRSDNRTCEYSGNMTCSRTTCKTGYCVVQGDEERCICPPGYEEREGQCIDKCSAATLPLGVCPDNQCEATPGGFRCKCEGKYKLSPDNVTCTVKSLCSKNEYGWKLCSERNATCVNVWNGTQGFMCKCPPGTVKMDDGSCREICAIEENKRKCSLLDATCSLDNNFDFSCMCPPSFQQANEGAPCNKLAKFSYLVSLPVPSMYYIEKQSFRPRIRRSLQDEKIDDHKLWKDITASMKELYEAFENANILQCTGLEDFMLCTVEFQFLETNLESLERIKDPEFCVSNARKKDNLCLIPPALILRKDKIQSHVSFERTDPCSELIRSGLCESSTDCTSSFERHSFSCTCKIGFAPHKVMYPLLDTNSVIETCNDIDECAESNPCPKSTRCSNTIGSYNCFCRPGYRTINDSSDPKKKGCVRLCDHAPCAHGTCKAAGDHNFECTCEPGFSGALCNLEDENYKDAKVNTIIVGAVLGGILLIVIIIFISKISCANRKYAHESGQLILGSTEMTERRQMRGGIFNDAFERE